MKNDTVKILLIIFVGFLLVKTCDNGRKKNNDRNYRQSSSTTTKNYQKTPVDKLITKYTDETDYSIILMDMESRSNSYFHKYQVIIERPDTVLSETTDWENVPEPFFASNIDNLGMEIVSKKDRVLSKSASPAGYNHYVGNEKYGQWRQDSRGSSFWEFYGKYAFMSSMFNMMTMPAYRSYYDDYSRGGYYGRRAYYGPGNTRAYGTTSYSKTSKGSSSSWGKQPSSFKSNVRSKVSRSTSKSSSRSYSSSSSYNKSKSSSSSSSKTSRSSSRYSSSSSRSRSGGFGK